MAQIQTVDTLLDIATMLIGTGGPYNAPKMALYRAGPAPNRTSILADFDITDFAGLTNLKTVVWGAPFVNAAQCAEVLGAMLSYLTVTAVGLPVSIGGYVIVNTAGTDLLLAEPFPAPLVFTFQGQNQGFVPRLVFDT